MNIKSFAKIHLGKSSTNTKEYIFKTDLELTNNFRTYPFGSNRMRYQYPEMFKYELIKLENQVYKLIVSRLKKPNCPVTAKYFWSDGWTLDLYVSNIPNLNTEEFYNKNNLISYLPENYGNYIINVPKNFKPNIGIVVPLFGRYEYTKKFLDSLNKTELKNCILVLIDESLTKNLNEDKIKTNELIKNYNLKCPSIKIFKNKHGNMFDSFLTGCDLLEPYCDFLMNLDSDTIHKKEWVNNLINIHTELEKKYSSKPILLSGFNTINTNLHKILEEKDNYYLKGSVGGCHLFFRKEVYNMLLRFTIISHKWDTNIFNIINKNKGIIAVSKPSVIEHIGAITSVERNNNKKNYWDKSIDF